MNLSIIKREVSNTNVCLAWWHTPLIPELRSQKGRVLSEFKASVVSIVSSRTSRTTQSEFIAKIKIQSGTSLSVITPTRKQSGLERWLSS